MQHKDPLRLDMGSGTFFGLAEHVFELLVATARSGPAAINELRLLDRIVTGYSGASLLKDGHVLGPVELFYPVDLLTF
jgi:hypothetical protein